MSNPESPTLATAALANFQAHKLDLAKEVQLLAQSGIPAVRVVAVSETTYLGVLRAVEAGRPARTGMTNGKDRQWNLDNNCCFRGAKQPDLFLVPSTVMSMMGGELTPLSNAAKAQQRAKETGLSSEMKWVYSEGRLIGATIGNEFLDASKLSR